METPTSNEAPASTAMPPTTQKYVPQFSAATEMILKRINAGNSSLGGGGPGSATWSGKPAGYEDMKKSILQGMKTTYNMEFTPPAYGSATARRTGSISQTGASSPGKSTPSSAGRARPIARKGGKTGKKRKREAKEDSQEETTEDEDDSDLEKTTNPAANKTGAPSTPTIPLDMPKITQSGRQINKPTHYVPPPMTEGNARKKGTKRDQEQALCKRCGRGHSPNSNQIVFCDGCNLGWHQTCHEPRISDDKVKDEDSPWYCIECGRRRGVKSTPPIDSTALASGAHKSMEEVPSMPSSSTESPLTMPQKQAYFNSLSQAQLVALLMRATTLHPHLPVFPPSSAQRSSNGAANPIQAYLPPRPAASVRAPALERMTSLTASSNPQQLLTHLPNSTTGLFARAEAQPSATMNYIRKIPSPYSAPVLPPYLTNMMRTSSAPGSAASNATPGIPPEQNAIGSRSVPMSGGVLPHHAINSGTAPPIHSSGSSNGGHSSVFSPNGPSNGSHASPNHIHNHPAHQQHPHHHHHHQPSVLHSRAAPPRPRSPSRESTPASPPFPKPGTGLMARLAADEEDVDWMVDHDDFAAFSHVVYAEDGSKAEENGILVA